MKSLESTLLIFTWQDKKSATALTGALAGILLLWLPVFLGLLEPVDLVMGILAFCYEKTVGRL